MARGAGTRLGSPIAELPSCLAHTRLASDQVTRIFTLESCSEPRAASRGRSVSAFRCCQVQCRAARASRTCKAALLQHAGTPTAAADAKPGCQWHVLKLSSTRQPAAQCGSSWTSRAGRAQPLPAGLSRWPSPGAGERWPGTHQGALPLSCPAGPLRGGGRGGGLAPWPQLWPAASPGNSADLCASLLASGLCHFVCYPVPRQRP